LSIVYELHRNQDINGYSFIEYNDRDKMIKDPIESFLRFMNLLIHDPETLTITIKNISIAFVNCDEQIFIQEKNNFPNTIMFWKKNVKKCLIIIENKCHIFTTQC
jgi:hypothetical protein